MHSITENSIGSCIGNRIRNYPNYKSTIAIATYYTIALAVTDQNMCHDTATIIVTVNEVPHANFSWATSCEDSNMPLSSTSTNGDGAIDSCIWLLWVGAPSPVTNYNCNTTFHFPPGLHDVQLVVHDLNGCLDTIVKKVSTDSLTQLVIYPGDTTILSNTPLTV